MVHTRVQVPARAPRSRGGRRQLRHAKHASRAVARTRRQLSTPGRRGLAMRGAPLQRALQGPRLRALLQGCGRLRCLTTCPATSTWTQKLRSRCMGCAALQTGTRLPDGDVRQAFGHAAERSSKSSTRLTACYHHPEPASVNRTTGTHRSAPVLTCHCHSCPSAGVQLA